MPSTQNGTVSPKRVPNAQLRPREYLLAAEIEELVSVARWRGRYGHRDATMILIAYRHGLRVSELCALRWDHIDFAQGLLHVNRLKHGTPSVHPLRGPEFKVTPQA
jgi:integrase